MHGLAWTLGVAAVACAAAVCVGGEQQENKVIELWPGKPPGGREKPQEEKPVTSEWRGKWSITRLQHVSKPTLTVFQPQKRAAAPGPAVVVCPGGGYSILAWDLEGTEICQWLNRLGVTGLLLKYRVPGQRDAAFADAQRAVGLARHHAKQWQIDPKRIGILGFSAGGHLAARVCTTFAKRSYEAVDEADAASCRPDFAVLIYPAYMAKGSGLDRETLPVGSDTSPAFIAIATKDRFTPGALSYFRALRTAKVRCELHVFQVGGHGCGLRKVDDGLTTWPSHCERWMKAGGLLP